MAWLITDGRGNRHHICYAETRILHAECSFIREYIELATGQCSRAMHRTAL